MSEDKKIEIISNISELLDFVDPDDTDRCLLALDMDDVIVRGESLGSDTWFRTSLKEGRDINDVLENMGLAYSLMKYSIVEPDTLDILTRILNGPNADNVDFLIITSRGIMYYSQTLKHLREAGVADLLVRRNVLNITDANDMRVDGIAPNPNDPKMYPRLHQIRYVDNICFCAGNDKALILEELVNRIHTSNPRKKYKKIVFVDDSIQNVNKVHTSFVNPRRRNLYRGIKTYSVHYSYMEIEKRKYNLESLRKDDERMRYIKNCISYINGKVELNYVVTFNVFMIVSILWWFAFKFLNLIV